MKIVFRADASLQIGAGHVMRCLTLAEAFAARGSECRFICREHPGNLIGYIQERGFPVDRLPLSASKPEYSAPSLAHATWLGSSQTEDAAACSELLVDNQCDWLVVDHYGLDCRWENLLRAGCRRLMVIDDLADRLHNCDLLLDQTFGRTAADYADLVPYGCTVLCGAQYALLRPEFAAERSESLQRRTNAPIRHLLVNMGGVDKENVTGQVLQALRHTKLPADCRIIVVMGATAPWVQSVRQQAERMPWPTEVHVGAANMAQLMAGSDLAIGAAGATSWERCCLGLPAIMVVLADNQRLVAEGLACAGAVRLLRGTEWIASDLAPLLEELVADPLQCFAISRRGADIVNGQGVATVIHHLER